MNSWLNAIGALFILLAQAGSAQTIDVEFGDSARIDPEGVAAPCSNSPNTELSSCDSPNGVARKHFDADQSEGVPAEQGTILMDIKPSSPNPETPFRLQPFATRHARYVPVSWAEIPDWRNGVTVSAWNAFAASCTVLIERLPWQDACEFVLTQPVATVDSAREFFENEFQAFQIRKIDSSDTGRLTGYYEPLLKGSRVRTSHFRYPVYGVPDDLLLIDARVVRKRRRTAHVRIDGRDVLPVLKNSSSSISAHDAKLYRLSVPRAATVPRDGKIRVRVNGNRVVPYLTRKEIEGQDFASAAAIAWVDDADVLYALHIEGSGRIELANGEILRVTYAEQNGHAFRPTVVRTVQPAQKTGSVAITNSVASVPRNSVSRKTVLMGQLVDSSFAAVAYLEVQTDSKTDLESESEDNATHFMESAIDGGIARTGETSQEENLPHVVISSHRDRSYVFFRQIPYSEAGPPGTMKIPLTPDASLAVDPRVTPLGAPVFIASRSLDSDVTTSRLMVAQDTGGAIRGAVRADYFLGFGPDARAAALRMKDELRMWVLLPKRLAIADRHIEPAGSTDTPQVARANCLMADPEFCTE